MEKGRNTVAKTEIQELVVNSEVALSHAEIQAATKGLCDRVTIYRVLDRLVKERLVHKVVNVDGVVKYAACHSCSQKHNDNDYHSHNHIHFSCQKCKSVTCLNDVEPSFQMPENYEVREMNFTLSGLCPNCAQTFGSEHTHS